MKRKFYLITNVSGMTYWSYKVGREDLDWIWISPNHARAVKKYGDIYINQSGGWMSANCVKTIHETVESVDFPAAPLQLVGQAVNQGDGFAGINQEE